MMMGLEAQTIAFQSPDQRLPIFSRPILFGSTRTGIWDGLMYLYLQILNYSKKYGLGEIFPIQATKHAWVPKYGDGGSFFFVHVIVRIWRRQIRPLDTAPIFPPIPTCSTPTPSRNRTFRSHGLIVPCFPPSAGGYPRWCTLPPTGGTYFFLI